jgi:hypothetical protein
MIKLTDLIAEAGKENRINPMRLVALLEKLVPTLKEAQENEVMKLVAGLLEGITAVNEMPYNYNTMSAWHMTELVTVVMPARDLREKLNSLLQKPTKGLDTTVLEMVIKSIDELYIY